MPTRAISLRVPAAILPCCTALSIRASGMMARSNGSPASICRFSVPVIPYSTVAAREGAPRPDIGSVEAFKRTLVAAKSIAYPPQGAVGIHLAQVFDRLGIAEQMKSKTKPQKSVVAVPEAVAAGEAELGFAPSTVFQPGKGIEVVGAYPSELQHYIIYATGVSASAKQPKEAEALLKYLMSAKSVAVIKAKGLEPLVVAH
jgi:molybdate transport system substrate-binding protein